MYSLESVIIKAAMIFLFLAMSMILVSSIGTFRYFLRQDKFSKAAINIFCGVFVVLIAVLFAASAFFIITAAV